MGAPQQRDNTCGFDGGRGAGSRGSEVRISYSVQDLCRLLRTMLDETPVCQTPARVTLALVFNPRVNEQLYLTLLYSRIPVYFKHTAVSLIGSVDSSREFGHAALALFAPPFAPVDVPASAAAGGLAVAEVVRGLGVGLRLNVTFQDYEFQRTSRHCRVSRWRNFTAWKDSHYFLMIDHHPKSIHLSGFRRNFDTFLIP